MFASLASQPGDVILSRVNKDRSSQPVLATMKDTVRELGVKGLFKGTVRCVSLLSVSGSLSHTLGMPHVCVCVCVSVSGSVGIPALTTPTIPIQHPKTHTTTITTPHSARGCCTWA